MKRVVFLLTAHSADDERVRFHQMPALSRADYQVKIVAPSTTCRSDDEVEWYNPNEYTRSKLIRHCAEVLSQIQPDIVIADTPMAVHSALKFRRTSKNRCKIIYDITEWYPSKKNLRLVSGLAKAFKFMALCAYNFYVNCHTDGFIFGEVDKSKPFRLLFPRKPYVFTSYYPDLQFIKACPARKLTDEVRLFYSGNLTEEKGFPFVLKVAVWVARFNPKTKVVLNVLSPQRLEESRQFPANLEVRISDYVPFAQFCQQLAENDIFLDLRVMDYENHRCLPIKLFYFMAVGRPVIYSDLEAIKKGCPEIDEFGFRVNPNNTQAIVDAVNEYIRNDELYARHCASARAFAEKKYNWKKIESDFVRFIKQYE